MNFPTQSPLVEGINKFLIEHLRMLVPDPDGSHSIPGQFVEIPFMMKVVDVCEMDREFTVMTWGGEAVTPEVH
jgi:hypothetical protein